MRTVSAQERAKDAEQRVVEKEQEVAQRVKEVEALKKRTFRASQALFQLRQNEANFIAEISGAQSASKNLKAKIAKLDNTAMQQQEHIYNGRRPLTLHLAYYHPTNFMPVR